MLKYLFAPLMLIVFLTGCRAGAVEIDRNPDTGMTDITVTLTESDINTLVQEALSRSANPLLRNPSVDLQTGAFVINGEHDRQDGGGTVSGSIRVAVSLVNGALQVSVTQADIEGWDVGDARIEQFNQQLATALGQRALQRNANAQLTDVTITPDSFTFTLSIASRR